ncbi:MAG: hypothetical protein GF307_02545 [candidate division Zixibacteria bacterium]|nr:hypothetical protein [candidate division Zixibacteria bacterium]
MKIRKWTILIVLIWSFIIAGCGSNESEPDIERYPTAKQSSQGYTDSNGEIEFDMTSHDVDVTVTAKDGTALPGIFVKACLLQNYLYVYACDTSSTPEYYSNCIYIPYEIMETGIGGSWLGKAPGIKEPVPMAKANPNVGLKLTPITHYMYSYGSESPLYLDAIYSDAWTSAVTVQGKLDSVYSLCQNVNQYGDVFVHLSDTVAGSAHSESKLATFPMDKISSYTEFATLLGLSFHIYSNDTLDISYITYEDSLLPVVYLNNIKLSEGDFWAQFTLTWGKDPEDLDSHLWTPEISGTDYHIYYVDRGDTTSAPYAELDLDDVTSYGPEHITITRNFSGTYQYAVYHFSGEGDLTTSGARVTLVKPDREVLTFTPPNDNCEEYWYWHVCNINGTSGAVSVINTLSADPPVDYTGAVNRIEKTFK